MDLEMGFCEMGKGLRLVPCSGERGAAGHQAARAQVRKLAHLGPKVTASWLTVPA